MNNDFKLLQSIYKTSQMCIFSINKVIEKLDYNQNKIKIDFDKSIYQYEIYRKTSKRKLRENKKEAKENGFLTKLSNSFGLTMELLKDNSTKAVADMLIKVIKMSIKEVKCEIKTLKNEFNADVLELAQEYQRFQRKEIKNLKEYVQ